ncbi:MAG: hypothetical protein Kow0069_27260 [Promethearchaeota archaeon]
MSKIYYTLVGTSPKAYANSLAWFWAHGPVELRPELVRFIASKPIPNLGIEGTRAQLTKAIPIIEENFRRLCGEENLPFKVDLHGVIEVPENDLLGITREIVLRAAGSFKEGGGGVAVFDVTAGRKAMSVAAGFSALFLERLFQVKSYLSYYWLANFTREEMAKPVWELAIDDVGLNVVEVSLLGGVVDEVKRTAGR